jgi:hypothetical protein
LHAGERRAGGWQRLERGVGGQRLAAGGTGRAAAAAPLQGSFTVADLRNERDEVGTLDYSDPAAAAWSVGRAVRWPNWR